VPWEGKSFESPPYWGVRGIYWLDVNPSWGVMVDYNHAKIYSELGATVKVSGTRNGVALNGKDRVSNTFDILEFTDGLNEIYLGGTYRWQHERWTPYVGLGVGLSFPHVEIRRTGSSIRTFEYQVTGVAVEGLVGLEYRITPRVSAFGDYKLSFLKQRCRRERRGNARNRRVDQSFHPGPLLPVRRQFRSILRDGRRLQIARKQPANTHIRARRRGQSTAA
jgi:opacity protein-like surface antigen